MLENSASSGAISAQSPTSAEPNAPRCPEDATGLDRHSGSLAALSRAVLLAAEAGQWSVVGQLAQELEALRRQAL